MEIEKVIRILAAFIIVASFAIYIASRLLFSESSSTFNLPLIIAIIVATGSIWRRPSEKTDKKNSNK